MVTETATWADICELEDKERLEALRKAVSESQNDVAVEEDKHSESLKEPLPGSNSSDSEADEDNNNNPAVEDQQTQMAASTSQENNDTPLDSEFQRVFGKVMLEMSQWSYQRAKEELEKPAEIKPFEQEVLDTIEELKRKLAELELNANMPRRD